jgi:hypothetical protein
MTADLSDDDKKQIAHEFREAVNMPKAALHKWLDTEESRSVGMTGEGDKVTGTGQKEAVGHAMGRHILDILDKPAAKLTDDDYAAMRKVVGYVHRHIVQRPHGDITDTRWRRSLMNWGHDPLKSK